MNNTVYILCTVALAVVAVLYRVAEKKEKRKDTDAREPGQNPVPAEIPAGCCGKHAVCEKYGTKSPVGSDDYFDDEELDRYKGRNSGSYSDKEIEEFRYVLYTMQQNEVIDWIQSLHTREIELPDQLKEEAFCMMNETV